MFVKQVVIDGFKSYATRTVIDDFDPKFNAITGLNGSGKSNILDAICFVLGITQLKQVRVSNLQGLVYKQGQSGVTKASVTIVFDNSDMSSSPVGYEQEKQITVTRQIAIGGRNKYLINGKNAQAKTVQNLFHSVQLNVNNPHFLIMQGRITKVLNMKPPEILGMIEEAAGTRMFEAKKLDAEKKMQQKEVKVEEIESILAQEIKPKLEKLRGEKQSYLKWSQQNAELERMQRYVVAYRYTQFSRVVQNFESERQQIIQDMNNTKAQIVSLEKQIRKLEQSGAAKETVEMKSLADEMGNLSREEDELSKALVKEASILKNRKAALKKLETKKSNLFSKRETLGKQLEKLTRGDQKYSENLNKAEANFKAAKQAYEKAKMAVHAAQAGMETGDDGQDGSDTSKQMTMVEKLARLKTTAEEFSTTAKQNRMKVSHLEHGLEGIKKKLVPAAKKDGKLRAEYEKQKLIASKLETKLDGLTYDPAQAEHIGAELEQQQMKLFEARNAVELLSAELGAFDFKFSNPGRGFKSSSVKGIVAKLITLNDDQAATALEVVAGGKLYNVVVDTVDTGKILLDKGNLAKRVTIIPLDKITPRPINRQRLKIADSIASETGGSARLSLSLVGYDDEIAKAMEYIFGTTLVCDSLTTARAVTFNSKVSLRSVTLDGDSFDPQGTLSGGSRSERSSVLMQLSKLRTAEIAVNELESTVKILKEKMTNMESSMASHLKLTNDISMAKHKLDLAKKRLDSTQLGQLEEHKAQIIEQIQSLSDAADDADKKYKENLKRASAMENDMQDMESARSKLLSKASSELEKKKKNYEEADKALVSARSESETAISDMEQIKTDEEVTAESIDNCLSEMEALKKEISDLSSNTAEQKRKYDDVCTEARNRKEELQAARHELESMSTESKSCRKQINELELKAKDLDAKCRRLEASRVESEKEKKVLTSKHPWIQHEKQFFGKPHTDFDFETRSPTEAIKHYKQLERSCETLGVSVNKKVMGMMGKVEQEYEELHRKRTIIEKDRATIERVIKDLEAKKNKALETTWEKVNKDFGSIFSTLLPGTKAKLDPPEDGSILDGLEVKVAFGETWKASLTELSGGQRSLLALALILSLLLFKPAPMYILDEVDAALDLSHTQNIGQMLRTHFLHSQFIVVSLKEGMFNNANVIFRTRFVDGLSTVQRIANEENQIPKEKVTKKVTTKNTRKRSHFNESGE